MPIDLPPPPKLWAPPKPAIIRAASMKDVELAMPFTSTFGAASVRGFRSAARAVGNDAFTVCLLHLNGTDGATTFTDDNFGGSSHTWTGVGNAQIDTAQSKFGGSSLLLDGTGDAISTPDHADFDLSAGEFTFDLWARFNALPTGLAGSGNSAFLASQWINASRAWVFGIEYTGSIYRPFFLHNNTTASGDAIGLTTGAFIHFEVVRDNTSTDTLRFFFGGAPAGTGSIDGVTIGNSTSAVYVGGSPEGHSYFNGWINEFRLSKGIARHTGAFTPLAAPYA